MENIIIRGPLGIGKSTIARKLAKKIDADYISIDKILKEMGFDAVDKEMGKIPLKNFLLASEKVQNTNKILVIEGNFYYKEQMEDLIQRLGNCKVFTLKAPMDECIQRDRTRSHSYGERAAKDVFKLVSEFDYGIVIDTENKSAKEVTEIILGKLK